MIKSFVNAFKVKEVRLKLLYTFAMLIVIRIGCQLPIPGINKEYFDTWYESLKSQSGNAFSLVDMFTGGSFTNASIFALNITPYITSSIVMQLLTIAIPKLEELQKERDGQKVIASITRYVTVGLALMEAIALAVNFKAQNLLNTNISTGLCVVSIVLALTAGSAFLMWIGEQINEKGIGNGISIVLVINIISRIPSDMIQLYEQFITPAIKESSIGKAVLYGVIIIAIILLTVVLVVLLNGGVRKIPVQYAKKVQGNRMIGGNNSHIPMRVNTAGVMPIIFASSIMQFPVVICSMLGKGQGEGVGSKILKAMQTTNWFNKDEPVYTWGLAVYVLLCVFFAYFYTSITINPIMISDNMKKGGGFIPGIRPGKPTTEYLTNVLNYIIFMGAIGLIIVAVIPILFSGLFGASVSFGGTSLIIIVSVVLETVKQVESMMLERNYKGFLNS
ncbi:MAG: preprotein translocase subunit SecY [Lachnospiraceae bacterium]|nr:preprotein translocase subunit SecY [Lachnospiraceae bacterium]